MHNEVAAAHGVANSPDEAITVPGCVGAFAL